MALNKTDNILYTKMKKHFITIIINCHYIGKYVGEGVLGT